MADNKDKDKNKKKDKSKKKNHYAQQARRDVNLYQQPLLDELKYQADQAKGDTNQYNNQVGTLYDALQSALGGLQPGFNQASDQIHDQYQGDIGFLQDLIGGAGVPSSEGSAFGNLVGATGAGMFGQLATDRQNQLDYNSSAKRQAGIENTSTQQNALADLQQMLDKLRGQRMDIKQQSGDLFKQRLDELRQQGFQNNMARGQLDLQKDQASALSGFLGQQIGDVTSGGGWNGGGGGGGGGGNGGGGNGGGGNGGGGNGGQDSRQLLQSVLHGNSRFGQNAGEIKSLLKSKADKNGLFHGGAIPTHIINAYNKIPGVTPAIGPNDPGFNYTGTSSLVQMLKKLSQYRPAQTGSGHPLT